MSGLVFRGDLATSPGIGSRLSSVARYAYNQRMADDPLVPLILSAQEQIEAIRRERANLLEQIAQSKKTIAQSQALIARLDALLARLDSNS